jgi:hypothetical protein
MSGVVENALGVTHHVDSPADIARQRVDGRVKPGLAMDGQSHQLHPVVAPQVSHLRQVPLRTMVKLPHSGQAWQTQPFMRAFAVSPPPPSPKRWFRL